MKNNLIIIILSILLFSCNKYEIVYPENNPVSIYVDNSKIIEFDILFVYNYIDTIHHFYKIKRVDTLKFSFDNDGLSEKNRDYRVEGYNDNKSHKHYDFYWKGDKNINIYEGDSVEVIIKSNGSTLENYFINLNKEYQYIINPLSMSVFKLDTIQYGMISINDLYQKDPYKYELYSDNFIKYKKDKTDFFLKNSPEKVNVTMDKLGVLFQEITQIDLEKELVLFEKLYYEWGQSYTSFYSKLDVYYKDELFNGIGYTLHENGRIKQITEFRYGKPIGVNKQYNENGKLLLKVYHDNYGYGTTNSKYNVGITKYESYNEDGTFEVFK